MIGEIQNKFPGFFTAALIFLFKPLSSSLPGIRNDRRKIPKKTVCPNRESNSQPSSHESHTLIHTKLPGGADCVRTNFNKMKRTNSDC